LVSKHPYTTWSVELEYDAKETPQDLINELKTHGWEEYGNIPPVNNRLQKSFSKQGSDIFGLWTANEQKTNLQEIKNILGKFGIKSVPKKKLTAADLL
jgi:hypothetical protein